MRMSYFVTNTAANGSTRIAATMAPMLNASLKLLVLEKRIRVIRAMIWKYRGDAVCDRSQKRIDFYAGAGALS